MPEVLVFGQQHALFADGAGDDAIVVKPGVKFGYCHNVMAERVYSGEVAALVGDEPHQPTVTFSS